MALTNIISDLRNPLINAYNKLRQTPEANKFLDDVSTVKGYVDDSLGMNSIPPQMQEAVDTAMNYGPGAMGTIVGKGAKGLSMAEQKIFRGDPNPINFDKYNPNSGIEAGKELGQSMAEGPGIYFTTEKGNALSYGKNITQANIAKGSKIIDSSEKKFTKTQINKMLGDVDRDTLDIALSNWDENPYIAKNKLIEVIHDGDNPTDQLMGIWSNVYYHQNPDKYMSLMAKHKIVGIEVPKDGLSHFVIYDKSKLSNIKQSAEEFLDE